MKGDPGMDENGSALTTKEFSDKTGLSVNTIGKLIRQGKLEGHKRAGKWMVPETQLQSPVVKGLSDDPAERVSDKNQSYYSVVEFSQMTYLTEFGVLDWLKKGKLHGRREPGGSWKVSASNLELAGLKHLLRK
jgi:predicted site-specific integrase-resolvase